MSEEFDIITAGESLIELSSTKDLLYSQSLDVFYGGDALAAAIAAARLGSKVGYISKVGNDSFKDYLLDSWQSEGLDISQVKLVESANGLYVIKYSDDGTREFSYYRKKSAGCNICDEDININYLKKAKIFYATGALQALSITAKEAIKKTFSSAKENGIVTAYKPNFIAKLISKDEAKENFYDVAENTDIIFLSVKGEGANLFDIDSPNNLIKYFWGLGISTVVIKTSQEKGYYTGSKSGISFTEFYTTDVVDTTGSSDAFAGAFLHATANGFSPIEATKLGAIVEGLQTQKIGAIKSIPKKDEVYKIYKG